MRRFAILLLLLLAALPAAAQTKATSAPDAAVPKIEFEHYTLPNGLDVILHVDRKLPIVHVNQWYHVGSKNERVGRTGFAHLFEHMMFQGSKNAKDEYFVYVERAGANLREGGVNGTTNNDRTNYFATAPAGSLEFLLWLESDRLATLADALDQKKLDNQIEVVRNERRQGLENQPYGRAFKLIYENLHPASHPYSWPVIGSHEDLTAASLEDVQSFFRTYYTPNNLTLVVAGDFDKEQAKALIAKYFGPIPAGPALDRPALFIPKLDGEKVIEVADRVPQERTYFAWPAPQAFAAEEAALDVASTVLTDGLSSRLNKVLVYDRQLASNVSSFNNSAEIAGAFVVIATARPGASLAEIEKVVTDEIAKLAKNGPTAEEVDRAKTKWEYNFVSQLERIGGFGGKADRLAQYNTYLRDPGYFDEDLARYRAVTPASVKAATAKWLDNPNRLLVRFHPEASSRAAGVVDRTVQPPLGADKTYTVPEVKTAKLSNGMELFVVERPELPKVAIRLDTRAGSVSDPAGKTGVAQMTVTNIDMGTPTRKALQIEDQLGNLGTSLFGSAAHESSVLGMEVLSRNIDPAMAVFADVVRNPVFPAEDFDREKKRTLDALAQQSNNPGAVASRVGPMVLFGREHPYGRPPAGLPSTVAAITREDVARFHKEYWKPGSSALTMVGDITLEKAKQLAEKHFGSWSGGAAPAVAIPAIAATMPRADVYLVDRQDAAQTIVLQAIPSAPRRASDDYYTLRLVDAVWGGGGFGTRLNLNLREDKGYSYGVFSSFAPFRDAGAWFASGGVQTDKTKESVVEFVKELEGLVGKKPIEAAELTTAQERWTRGYAQQYESLGRIAQQIATVWRFGLPLSELQREAQEPTRITLDQVRAAAQKYVRPQDAPLILVGDLSKIEEGIRGLNLGEVVVLDVEGNVVAKR